MIHSMAPPYSVNTQTHSLTHIQLNHQRLHVQLVGHTSIKIYYYHYQSLARNDVASISNLWPMVTQTDATAISLLHWVLLWVESWDRERTTMSSLWCYPYNTPFYRPPISLELMLCLDTRPHHKNFFLFMHASQDFSTSIGASRLTSSHT